MAVLKMTVDEWIVVPNNPRQRDTESRAARAKHLRTLCPDHSHVAMAVVKGNGKYKLDGHTRAFLWAEGRLDRPRGGLDVSVYHVGSVEDAMELYTHFDNKSATKSATDDVHGAYRLMGWEPQSGLLKAGRITSGIKSAWAITCGHGSAKGNLPGDIADIVSNFAHELKALDSLGCGQGGLCGAEQAAFFLSFRKHGERALQFWRAYLGNGGVVGNGEMDGVMAMRRLIEQRKASKTIAGGDNQHDITTRAINCIERWMRGDTFSVRSGVKALDIRGYIPKKKKAA